MSILAMLAEAAGEAHGEEGAISFPPFETWHFPSQLFYLAITFGGLYIAMSRYILPQLSANIERRSDTIAKDLDEAARLNEQAEEAQDTLDQNLAKARAKARATAAEAEAEMTAEIAAETRRVDSEIESRLIEAEGRITELRETAMKNVEVVAIETTHAVLSRFDVSVSEGVTKSAVQSVLASK